MVFLKSASVFKSLTFDLCPCDCRMIDAPHRILSRSAHLSSWNLLPGEMRHPQILNASNAVMIFIIFLFLRYLVLFNPVEQERLCVVTVLVNSARVRVLTEDGQTLPVQLSAQWMSAVEMSGEVYQVCPIVSIFIGSISNKRSLETYILVSSFRPLLWHASPLWDWPSSTCTTLLTRP